jgi:hypothetical protein
VSSSNSFPAGTESYGGVSNQEICPFSMGAKSQADVNQTHDGGYGNDSSGAPRHTKPQFCDRQELQ